MLIQWTEDLSVGVNSIDNQHQELFSQINRLLDACNQGRGKQVIGEVFKFLEDYVVTHFNNEEFYMQKYNYPQYREHKEFHAQFIQKMGEMKKLLEEEGPGPHIVIMTNQVVVSWLNAHIRNVDKKLGAFLKEKLS